jgi:peptidoglycan/xylan/chitin deacetylase (PgdA/CDA1 family)
VHRWPILDVVPPILTRRRLLGIAVAGLLASCGRASRRNDGAQTSTPASPSGAATSQATTSPASSSPLRTVAPTRSAAPFTGPSSSRPVAGGPATEIRRGDRLRPEIALTFHGAGDPALARAILSIMASHRASMTVMAVGTWLSDNPTMARAIIDGGHELGNHTWSHPTLADLDQQSTRTEIRRCRDLLTKLTGTAGAVFRQSGSQFSTELIRVEAGAAGYPVCLSYDVDSLDWTDPGAAAVRRNAAAATAGSIVSLHLGHQGTVDALPGILDDLAGRGLSPVTASRLIRP